MARKKVEEELTRAMIVDEADRQFLQQDFEKVSMRAIAKALGCSHGALYYHFSNKNDIFSAVIEKYFDMLNLKLGSCLDKGAVEGTMAVLCGYIEFGLDYQSQYDFMFVMRANAFDPLKHNAPNESYHKFSQTLQTLNQGRLLPEAIYSTFIALHGFVLSYKGRVNHFSEAKQAAEQHCEFLIKALVN